MTLVRVPGALGTHYSYNYKSNPVSSGEGIQRWACDYPFFSPPPFSNLEHNFSPFHSSVHLQHIPSGSFSDSFLGLAASLSFSSVPLVGLFTIQHRQDGRRFSGTLSRFPQSCVRLGIHRKKNTPHCARAPRCVRQTQRVRTESDLETTVCLAIVFPKKRQLGFPDAGGWYILTIFPA